MQLAHLQQGSHCNAGGSLGVACKATSDTNSICMLGSDSGSGDSGNGGDSSSSHGSDDSGCNCGGGDSRHCGASESGPLRMLSAAAGAITVRSTTLQHVTHATLEVQQQTLAQAAALLQLLPSLRTIHLATGNYPHGVTPLDLLRLLLVCPGRLVAAQPSKLPEGNQYQPPAAALLAKVLACSPSTCAACTARGRGAAASCSPLATEPTCSS